MKLSIITVCYNQPDIAQTCDSIINQSFQDFEWIVIDGGSTDETLEILKKYQQRIKILVSETDDGIYDAMNKGIKLAQGEWLNFMNGGDEFVDNLALEKIFSSEYMEDDIIFGYMQLEKQEKSTIVHQYPEQIDKKYLLNNCINHQASFIKRELFKNYGLYDLEYKYNSEWEKWMCFLSNGCKFKLVPEIISVFKADGVSFNPCNKIEAQKLKDRENMILKYYEKSELKDLQPYKKIRFKLLGLIPFVKIFFYFHQKKVFLFELPILTLSSHKQS